MFGLLINRNMFRSIIRVLIIAILLRVINYVILCYCISSLVDAAGRPKTCLSSMMLSFNAVCITVVGLAN